MRLLIELLKLLFREITTVTPAVDDEVLIHRGDTSLAKAVWPTTGGGSGTIDASSYDVLTGTATDTNQELWDKADVLFLDARQTGYRWWNDYDDSLGAGVIEIGAGEGAILDNTDPANPSYYPVSWSLTNKDLSATDGRYWIYVDNTGTVQASAVDDEQTHEDYRTKIQLCRVVIRGGIITGVARTGMRVQQNAAERWDIWRAYGLAKHGLKISAGSTPYTINLSSGEVYGPGISSNPLNPNEVDFAAQTPITFRYVTSTNTQSADTTILPHDQWEEVGVGVSTIPGTGVTGNQHSGIFLLYMFPNGNIRILLPQRWYNTRAEAEDSLPKYRPVIPSTFSDAIRLGAIICEKVITDWQDENEALLLSSNNFGSLDGGGGSTTTISESDLGLESVIVATYADAVTAATGTRHKLITVTADEKNNDLTTSYYYKGTPSTIEQAGIPARFTLADYGTQANLLLGEGSGENLDSQPFESGVYGSIVSAQANTLIGVRAGESLDRGNENTFVGYEAGRFTTIGPSADPLQEGALNTFVGSFAGTNNTTGYANVFLGQKAGQSNTVGNHSIYIGKSTGGNNTGPGINVMIGSGSCGLNSGTAQSLVFIGYGAGLNCSGNQNTIIGASAGTASGFSGVRNVIIGASAGTANTTGTQNVFLGYQTGIANTNGGSNTVLGYRSLINTNNYNNIAIGSETGNNANVGRGNILLGCYAANGITATINQTFVAGGDDTNTKITNVYFGRGVSSATPEAYTINGTANTTTNGNGADINLTGGAGNGTGLRGKVVITKATLANNTLLATPENGVFEWNGSALHFTTGGIRKVLANSGDDVAALQTSVAANTAALTTRPTESSPYTAVAQAASITLTATATSTLLKTTLTTTTNIGTITLGSLTEARLITWHVVNSSGGSRTITLPAGSRVAANNKSESYYASGVLTLADGDIMDIIFDAKPTVVAISFTKYPSL